MKLQLQNIIGGYSKNQDIIRDLNLVVLPGESISIIGQNGAGKSTLARLILGMIPFFSGKVIYNGIEISKKSTNQIIKLGIGCFMQGGKVFPHLTVYENLILAGNDLERSDLDDQINKLSSYFTFFNKLKLKKGASYLSGGERHQLALAMVFMRNPSFLILDEPSAGLSPESMNRFYDIIQKLREDSDLGIILIEQNISKAIEFSDRVLIIRNGIGIEFNKNKKDDIYKSLFYNTDIF